MVSETTHNYNYSYTHIIINEFFFLNESACSDISDKAQKQEWDGTLATISNSPLPHNNHAYISIVTFNVILNFDLTSSYLEYTLSLLITPMQIFTLITMKYRWTILYIIYIYIYI